MLAEAFRQPGERMPIGGLGLIGLVGAAGRVGAPLGPRRRELRRRRAPTTSRSSSTSCSCVVGILTMAVLGTTSIERERPAGRRVLRADAVRDRGHDADGGGDRPAGHLPRARDHVAGGLRADRHPARQRRERRGGVQVLPARRRSRARSSSTASRSPTRSPAATRLERIGRRIAAAGDAPAAR